MAEKVRWSAFVCEETLHQKRIVPGPTTVVSSVLEVPSTIVPLCAAASPSCVTLVWTVHGAPRSVLQVRYGAFIASPTVSAAMTLNWTGELTMPPAVLLIATE